MRSISRLPTEPIRINPATNLRNACMIKCLLDVPFTSPCPSQVCFKSEPVNDEGSFLAFAVAVGEGLIMVVSDALSNRGKG